jgi:MYXO-CTERM domain-containing protein
MQPQVRIFASLALVLAPALATASPNGVVDPIPEGEGVRVFEVADEDALIQPGPGGVSNIIFLNRCVGGCTITTSPTADARTNMSPIPQNSNGTQNTLSEFAHGEPAWQTVLACVQAVYAPYDVVVTDVDPGGAVLHHEAIVAGFPAEIDRDNQTLGVGLSSPSCMPYDNGISFAFANAHADMEDLCWTIAQEVGHTYGLDHVFTASNNGFAACTDPMTYTPGCGRKYFRNKDFTCGEYELRACRCGAAQNSHVRLLATFGESGTALPTPTVNISVPADGAMVTANFSVFAESEAERGVIRVELWLNGFKWLEVDGRRPDQQGGVYTLTTPPNVPDGIIDVEVRGVNDLGTGFGMDRITVTKGAPCTSADTCATGQRCDAGRCLWDPPTGAIGDECTYDQFCLSGTCRGTCTEDCFVGVTGDCPDGFVCEAESGNNGFCFEDGGGGGGGCCSSSGTDASPGALFAQLGLLGLVVGGAISRRRRRR